MSADEHPGDSEPPESGEGHDPQQATGPTPLAHRDSNPDMLPGHFTSADYGPSRSIVVEGEEWLARVTGEGAVGVGFHSHAFLVAVHFFHPSDPTKPLREAVLTRGTFEVLYDAELIALFNSARVFPEA